MPAATNEEGYRAMLKRRRLKRCQHLSHVKRMIGSNTKKGETHAVEDSAGHLDLSEITEAKNLCWTLLGFYLVILN
jgi:hypothetical protein